MTCNTVVVNWLTFGSSAEAERNLTRLTQDRMEASPGQPSATTSDGGGGELGLEISTHGHLKEPKEPQVAVTPNAGVVDISPA